MTASRWQLHCDIDPEAPAGVPACPCLTCQMIRRGIKDDFDVTDLQDAERHQRLSELRVPRSAFV
jgi:hypothetical protein